MSYIKKDLDFGISNEEKIINILKEKFDKNLEKIKNNLFVFDFSSDKCYVELKTRRNKKDKYPDTMIGYNKIVYAMQTDRPVYFCFSFYDGLYYYEFNKEDLNNDNIIIKKGGRCDRGRYEYKDYAFIKTNILKLIC
jgi:hypothetical protein